jgi:transcriptional regulator with GAF, ATPase, and Fis domain
MPALTAAAKRAAATVDRAAIFAAFKKAGGKPLVAAKLLRVAHRTLNKRILELGIREKLFELYPPRTGKRRKRKAAP